MTSKELADKVGCMTEKRKQEVTTLSFQLSNSQLLAAILLELQDLTLQIRELKQVTSTDKGGLYDWTRRGL